MFARAPALALVALMGLTSILSAQWVQPRTAPGAIGLSFLIAEPTGDFEQFVNTGYGGELTGRIPVDPMGVVSIRADLGWVIYGYESKRVCLSDAVGCRIQNRLETLNNIFFGGVGPELAIPGRFARPYVNAFLGFGYFSTISNLEDWYYEDYGHTENLGDGTVSWGAGGGVELTLSRGRVPFYLNIGAKYHRNGLVEYLTEGDIVDHPDGSITLYPVQSQANLVTYRIGLTIGIGGGDDDDRHRGKRRR